MKEVVATLEKAKKQTGKGKPIMIIMDTEMGYGVDFMQGTHKWHGKAPDKEEYDAAINELESLLTGTVE